MNSLSTQHYHLGESNNTIKVTIVMRCSPSPLLPLVPLQTLKQCFYLHLHHVSQRRRIVLHLISMIEMKLLFHFLLEPKQISLKSNILRL
jgi:hypothetical protein